MSGDCGDSSSFCAETGSSIAAIFRFFLSGYRESTSPSEYFAVFSFADLLGPFQECSVYSLLPPDCLSSSRLLLVGPETPLIFLEFCVSVDMRVVFEEPSTPIIEDELIS